MHFPDEIELHIERMAQGGAGVGRWNGIAVFASGGLPGEHVRVRVDSQKSAYALGTVVEVLAAAPERIAPRLPDADHMPWQHIDYPAQVLFKREILREQLGKLAGLPDPPVAAVIPAAQPWGYRNTAHLHVADGQIGYYAAQSHTVCDLDADPLLLPVLNLVLGRLRQALPEAGAALHSVTLRGSATYGYAIAALRGADDPAAAKSLATLAECWRSQTPELAGVAVNPRQAQQNASAVTLHEELGGVVFSLGTDSFFQANTAQAEVLLAELRQALALQPDERLLDAYSGIGTFALPLARMSREIIAIEENAIAVADGERSARLNAIDNVTFVTAPVERALTTLETPIGAAILDPPRRGCHPAALAALTTLAPARIAYISCHPGILARDLRPLLAAGYRLTQVQPIDLFPQTPHIECLALLVR
jgi:23S rRNA (uracil1939-C5)-methyltransferase